MKKVFAAAIILSAMVSGAALAHGILPTACLILFDPDTFAYVYWVICPEYMTYPFGYFQVDAKVPCDGTWAQTGPWTPSYLEGTNRNWTHGVSTWEYDELGEPVCDFAYWRASGSQEIMPGTAWSGEFVMTVPNTQPGWGWIYTKGETIESQQRIDDLVPCPIPDGGQPVPEPSSIIALAGGLGSLLAFRRRGK